MISDIDVSVHLLDPCKVGMEINLLQRFESESHQSSSDRDARPPEDQDNGTAGGGEEEREGCETR